MFLAQVILQPLFLLFVFGKVLGSLGYTQHGYADLLFPGLLALTAVITGMQTLAFPLVIEFGWTKEIEDRLLAPMSTGLVAAEKVVFATLRAIIATALMIPSGSSCSARSRGAGAGVPLLVLAMVLGSLLGAGARARARHARRRSGSTSCSRWCSRRCCSPGCSQYPWPSLAQPALVSDRHRVQPDDLRQRVDARARSCPDVPHIAPWICVVVLVGSLDGAAGDRRPRLLPARDRLIDPVNAPHRAHGERPDG